MSNDLTPTTNDDGWSDAAADANARVLRGALVTFSEGRWYRVKEKTEIPLGTRYAASATAHYWQRWKGGKPAEVIMRQPGKTLPERKTLGDLNEDDWEMDRDGETPKDPWQNTRACYLVDPFTAELLTFTTTTYVGRDEVTALGDQIMRIRHTHPGAVPIIELGWAPHLTKRGRKTKPVMKVVEWRKSGSLVEGDEPQLQIAHAATKSAKAIENAKALDDDVPW